MEILKSPSRFERELDKHKLTHLSPQERMAYRCTYCGIIFDSISHRERHEQRHKAATTMMNIWGVMHLSLYQKL